MDEKVSDQINEDEQNKSKSRIKKILLLVISVFILLGLGAGLFLLPASKKPAFCASCHVMQPYYQSWENGNLLAHDHAENDLQCLDCHTKSLTDKMKEGVKFITGDYEEPLTPLNFPREKCLQCHKDFDQVIASTDHGGKENPHSPPHSNEMQCTMCHSMHKESQLYCTKCHDFDWANDLGKAWTS